MSIGDGLTGVEYKVLIKLEESNQHYFSIKEEANGNYKAMAKLIQYITEIFIKTLEEKDTQSETIDFSVTELIEWVQENEKIQILYNCVQTQETSEEPKSLGI